MKKDLGRIGLVCRSGFKHLAVHQGALEYFLEASEKGLTDRPYFMTGGSAGALICTALNPWNGECSRKVGKTIYNLQASQIYEVRRQIQWLAVLTGAESFLGFLDLLLSKNSTLKTRLLLKSAWAVAALMTESGLFHQVLNQPSLFSNRPLWKLLSDPVNGLDFAGIWNSDVRLEIPAVDLLSEKEVVFSNYREEDRNRPDRSLRLLEQVIASSSIPAHFPAISVENQALYDAAIKNSIPIHLAVQAGCDTIFVFIYSLNGIRPRVENWVDKLTRSMDILINENIRKTLKWHMSINNDLLVKKEEDREAEEMKELCQQVETALSDRNKLIKSKLEKKLSDSKNRRQNYSFHGKKETRIIPVFSRVEIPDLNFRQFDNKQLNQAMRIGYEAAKEALENPDVWQEIWKE